MKRIVRLSPSMVEIDEPSYLFLQPISVRYLHVFPNAATSMILEIATNVNSDVTDCWRVETSLVCCGQETMDLKALSSKTADLSTGTGSVAIACSHIHPTLFQSGLSTWLLQGLYGLSRLVKTETRLQAQSNSHQRHQGVHLDSLVLSEGRIGIEPGTPLIRPRAPGGGTSAKLAMHRGVRRCMTDGECRCTVLIRSTCAGDESPSETSEMNEPRARGVSEWKNTQKCQCMHAKLKGVEGGSGPYREQLIQGQEGPISKCRSHY